MGQACHPFGQSRGDGAEGERDAHEDNDAREEEEVDRRLKSENAGEIDYPSREDGGEESKNA